MNKISIIFYDGVSSDPRPGYLELDSVLFRLFHQDGSLFQEYSYHDVEHVHSLRQGASTLRQAEMKAPSPAYPGVLIDFEQDADYQNFYEHWKSKKGFTKQGLLHFDKMNLPKKLITTLIIGAGGVFLIFLMFANAHLFTPPSYDVFLGEKVVKQLDGYFEPCRTAELDHFIAKASEDLKLPEDRFITDIQVINHPMENAVAFPGGKVYVFKGLLENSKSPEEVIGVLGHELEHTQARHGVQQMFRTVGTTFLITLTIGALVEGIELMETAEIITEITSTLLYLKYSRSFEEDADIGAVKRLHQSQITVAGIKGFFERISHQHNDSDWKDQGAERETGEAVNFLSTHPTSYARSDYFDKMMKKESFGPNPRYQLERDHWDAISHGCPDDPPEKDIWEYLLPEKKDKKKEK